MNELSFLLKIHDALEDITPDNFSSIKSQILEMEQVKKVNKKRIFSGGMRLAFALCIFMILTGSVTVAAYKLTGGDFFHMFYSRNVQNNVSEQASDQVFLGAEQYEAISSSTIGTVVETDEITIDVLGAIASGNVSNIMLRITANQLEDITYDNGIEPLKNYRFNDDTGGSLFNRFQQAGIRNYYHDEIQELKPNQFEILYTVIGYETFAGKSYTLELNKFGYFSKENGFVTKYNNKYSFQMDFDIAADYSRIVDFNHTMVIEGQEILIKQINLTPFSLCIYLQGRALDDDMISTAVSHLDREAKDLKIAFREGTILDRSNFTYTTGGSRANQEGIITEDHIGNYQVIVSFNRPINVEMAESFKLHGEWYDIK